MEFLRSIDFIEKVRVVDDEASTKPELPLNPFERFYGTLPDLDVDAFELYLRQTREEWERNIY